MYSQNGIKLRRYEGVRLGARVMRHSVLCHDKYNRAKLTLSVLSTPSGVSSLTIQ